MAETNVYKTLYQDWLPSSVGTLATVGVGKSWIPRKIVVTNTDSVARTYSLYVGGTTDKFLISTKNASLQPGESDVYDEVDALGAGEAYSGVASAASVVSIRISGDEVTL